MESIQIKQTNSTIGVILNYEKHFIEFCGDSRPENVREFFDPIMVWINEYKNYVYFLSNESSHSIIIKVDFKFEYFNSSSAKYIVDIIKTLNSIVVSNNKIVLNLNWCYEKEDNDILDSGKEFIKITEIPMNLISY